MAIKKRKRMTFEKSSGNVFADIGFANPEREQLKAQLTLQIYRVIKDRDLTQAEAGTILGIKQPHVSALMRNRSVQHFLFCWSHRILRLIAMESPPRHFLTIKHLMYFH